MRIERIMTKFVLTVFCQSTRGIVVSAFLTDMGCNIVDSSQFDDLGTARLFMTFISEEGKSLECLTSSLKTIAEKFKMRLELFDQSARMKVLLMASRFGHCFNDLLYRWKIGAHRARSTTLLRLEGRARPPSPSVWPEPVALIPPIPRRRSCRHG